MVIKRLVKTDSGLVEQIIMRSSFWNQMSNKPFVIKVRYQIRFKRLARIARQQK